MTRDRVADAIQRAHRRSLANATVEVYTPDSTHTPGEGFSVSYPSEPSASVQARVETEGADAARDRSGTTSEADATIRVPDEPGFGEDGYGADGFGSIAYTEYGDTGRAPARLLDTSTGTWYEVVDWQSNHNGLLEIDATQL